MRFCYAVSAGMTRPYGFDTWRNPLQEENDSVEALAKAREKKAAKKARRKERDAALKAAEEPLPAASPPSTAAEPASSSHTIVPAAPAAEQQPPAPAPAEAEAEQTMDWRRVGKRSSGAAGAEPAEASDRASLQASSSAQQDNTATGSPSAQQQDEEQEVSAVNAGPAASGVQQSTDANGLEAAHSTTDRCGRCCTLHAQTSSLVVQCFVPGPRKLVIVQLVMFRICARGSTSIRCVTLRHVADGRQSALYAGC